MTLANPGTPAWLRTHNDRVAFQLMLEHGALSRSQLSALSGMSKPTAGQMISRLEQAGLVEAVGENTTSRGPNAVLYGVRRGALTGVAVNILGHEIEATVTDPLGTTYPVVTIPVSASGRTPEGDLLHAIEAASAAAEMDPSSVGALAIGVQGAVDAGADRLSFADTLRDWPLTGSRARIEAATGAEVILDNDVNLAAVAERASGAIDHDDDFAYLWLGNGLGMGLDLGGTIHRGATGSAGEIGYLEVPRSALDLDPGAMDFTDLLGREAIVALLGGHPDSELADVLPASLAGLPVLDEVAARVALLVAPVLALYDPAVVVLGGPTGFAGGPELAERVQQRIDAVPPPRNATRPLGPRTRIATAAVVERPVLAGASRLLVANIRALLDQTITSG
ncbi:MAG: ROK family transcriptional regulator [Arachnia sp.]